MKIKWMGRFAMACAIVACVAFAVAQGGGGGRGGFRQGGRFGMMDRSGLGLLGRADVQRDLAITDAQKTQITALQDKQREEMRAAFEAIRNGGGQPDPDAMRAEMEKRNAATKVELAKILSADQVKRLDEIRIQLAGNRAVMDPDVQKTLGIDDSQKAKITELNQKFMDANRSLFQQVQDGSMTREQLRDTQRKNEEALGAEIAKILTDAQQAKLKEIGGKPFKADAPQRPPR